MNLEPQFLVDLQSAVDALPVSAISMAAGLAYSLPGAVLSVEERDYLATMLARRGNAAPTVYQRLLLATLHLAGRRDVPLSAARDSGMWRVLQAAGCRASAIAAMEFRQAVAQASARRWSRALDAASLPP